MKRLHPLSLLFTALLAAPSLMQAATTMRPGLWEHTSRVTTQNGEMERSMQQMQQQMAAMSPEQRKMMQNMMNAQGVDVSAQGNRVRICVTPQESELALIPSAGAQCTHTVTRRSADTLWFRFQCRGSHPSHGEGKFTFRGNRAYSGTMKVTTTAGGRNETVQMEQSGKWLSDDCGRLKPPKR